MAPSSQRAELTSSNLAGATMTLFKISQDYALKLYEECLQKYFNELKPIPLKVEPINELGLFKFDIAGFSLVNPQIIISNKKYRTDEGYKNTILHELIHYSIYSKLSADEIYRAISSNNQEIFDELLEMGKHAHDKKWNSEKDTINNIYNLNIR